MSSLFSWFLNSRRIVNFKFCFHLDSVICKKSTNVIDNNEQVITKKIGISKEMHEFMERKCPQYQDIPIKYLRKARKDPEYLYIFDLEVADRIINKIKSHVMCSNCILELNPGLGILSKHLIQFTSQLRLYEGDPIFIEILKSLQDQHSGKLNIYHCNLVNLFAFERLDRLDDGCRVQTLFKEIPPPISEEAPSFHIIGAISDRRFIWYIINGLIFQSGLTSYGTPELYLCMPQQLYQILTSTPDSPRKYYQRISVLCQLLFQITLLDNDIPREAFLPWVSVRSSKRHQLEDFMQNRKKFMHLVKISVKKDFLDQIISLELLQSLWYFVKHFMINRSKFVIPSLELIVPGCGSRLIGDGYYMYTEFGELNSEQLLNLFLKFTQWPEYATSSFSQSVMDVTKKYKSHIQDNEDKFSNENGDIFEETTYFNDLCDD